MNLVTSANQKETNRVSMRVWASPQVCSLETSVHMGIFTSVQLGNACVYGHLYQCVAWKRVYGHIYQCVTWKHATRIHMGISTSVQLGNARPYSHLERIVHMCVQFKTRVHMCVQFTYASIGVHSCTHVFQFINHKFKYIP